MTINHDYIGYLATIDGQVKIMEFPIEDYAGEVVEQLSLIDVTDRGSLAALWNRFNDLCPEFWAGGYCFADSYSGLSEDAEQCPVNPCLEYDKKVLGIESDLSNEERSEELYYIAINSANRFLRSIRNFSDAINYEHSLEKLISKHKPVFYSSDYVGWQKHMFKKISDSLDILLRTNFCHGQSSYFVLTVRYKGIDILPYSFLVEYKFARIEDIIRGTRLFPMERESWESALQYVADLANEARTNEKAFIKKYILSGVMKMMNGLDDIMRDPSSTIESMLGEDGLIRVNYVETDWIQDCLVYSEEEVASKKIEKINGALKLISNLSSLSEEFPTIKRCISRIKKMNKAVLPEMESLFASVSDSIASFKELVELNEKRLKIARQKKSSRFEIQEALEELSKANIRLCQRGNFQRYISDCISDAHECLPKRKS